MKNKIGTLKVLRLAAFMLIVLLLPLFSCPKTALAEDKVDYWNGSKVVTVSEKKFLQKYGFNKKKAFYKGYDEKGELAVKLYFDPKTKKGCGITYHNGVTFGFAIDEKDNTYSTTELEIQGKYSLIPQQGILGTDNSNTSWKSYLKKNFPDCKENREYKTINKKKRLTCVTVTGKDPDPEDSEDPAVIDIIKITFNYSKWGRLLSKRVALSYKYFMTSESSYVNYYNSEGHLYYRTAYITHGDLQYMFLYDENKETPSYVLLLDNNCDMMDGALYKVVEKE